MPVKSYDILKKVSEFEIGSQKMIGHLNADSNLVHAYIAFALTDDKYAWRATWLLSHYSNKHTEILQNYVDKFIQSAKSIEANGHLRETLKIIYNLELNEEQISEVFDLCMTLLEDNKRQASVRMIAFNFVYRVAIKYPELQNEIEIIVENIKDYLSPGIIRSMRKRISKIKTTTK